MISVYDQCIWSVYMVSVYGHGQCIWSVYMVSVYGHGQCIWSVYMISVYGQCIWSVYMYTLSGFHTEGKGEIPLHKVSPKIIVVDIIMIIIA